MMSTGLLKLSYIEGNLHVWQKKLIKTVQRIHGDWGEYLRVKEQQWYSLPTTAPTNAEKFAEKIGLWKQELKEMKRLESANSANCLMAIGLILDSLCASRNYLSKMES